MAKPLVKDRRKALVGGILCICAGSILLWDAYDNRGISRPFLTRFLPGG